MNILTVMAKQLAYPIYFDNSYDNLRNAVKYAGLANRKAVILTDSNVEEIYLREALGQLKDSFSDIYFHSFPAGEQNKNLDTIKSFYGFFSEKNLDRQSVVLALGGGVTGDMAGFAAATYMRGIGFVQLPTTLLSQVDSSVGGKVGVDFLGNKNFIGAFYQPRFVYINSKTIESLPPEQFTSGLGEVIKHGLIRDISYYKYILDNTEQILNKNSDTLEKLVEGSCRIKAEVVELDEREESLRQILNFGHTYGHAIESLSNFTELHGHCVAHGMRGGLHLSFSLGNISKVTLREYDSLLKSLGFPQLKVQYSADEIYAQMLSDKKTKNDRLNLVALDKVGNAYVVSEAPKEYIMKSIDYILKGELI